MEQHNFECSQTSAGLDALFVAHTVGVRWLELQCGILSFSAYAYWSTCYMFTDAAAFLYVKLSLDLELTVAEENVGGFDIPVDDRPCVDEFGRRRELSDTLGGPHPVNAAILPTTQTSTAETLQLW